MIRCPVCGERRDIDAVLSVDFIQGIGDCDEPDDVMVRNETDVEVLELAGYGYGVVRRFRIRCNACGFEGDPSYFA